MRRCLGDQTLLLLYGAEGTEAQQTHLQACEACAKRYKRLVYELEVIGQVLREDPPLHHHPQPLYLRWIPVATALAVTLALVWGGMWAWRGARSVLPEKASNEDVSIFLDEVSTAIFSSVETGGVETLNPVSDFGDLRVALREASLLETGGISFFNVE